MKKYTYLLLLFSFIHTKTQACDICGCFMGITPYDNQSSVGVLHRYRSFNGYKSLNQKKHFFPRGGGIFTGGPNNEPGGSHSHNGNPTDFEVYRVTELRGKYFIHQRVELNAFVPYVQNTTQYNQNRTTLAGIGDINIFAGLHLLRQIEVAGVQQRLIVGGGIKLPTGHYYRANGEGIRYPLLYQTGTGSVDYFGYVNYIAGYKKFGLSLNSSYKINGENYYHESIANSSAHFANLFYRYHLNDNWNINPSVQFFYEYTKGEKFKGELTGEHKMNNALLGPGFDIYYKNAGINLAFQLPVFQEDIGHPASSGRLMLGFSYNFNQTKYLIKSN
ncbi:hypothetical protein AHMF7605_02985 [Adhaeribacter arboris]|uniref:Transporter n=1 Tax=Adhaeribacter arboris TaxID=2072846 RepID=A0A2T2YAM5_9BACT|nr:hypothetical protein [Adhaeribacter arboris]PSR52562.1 hypothetical protein AHMF7605_02985 [Adhaeribacter arboris]